MVRQQSHKLTRLDYRAHLACMSFPIPSYESLLAIVRVGLTDTPIVLELSADAGRREIFIDQLALSM